MTHFVEYKADIPRGYSRADCIRARFRDGRYNGASEKDDARVQAGSAIHCDTDRAVLGTRHVGEVGPE
jgi:hypothetical protein